MVARFLCRMHWPAAAVLNVELTRRLQLVVPRMHHRYVAVGSACRPRERDRRASRAAMHDGCDNGTVLTSHAILACARTPASSDIKSRRVSGNRTASSRAKMVAYATSA
jgi:hypothetical protein